MALVRVYCGLASAYPPRRLAVGSSSLTATIVDDAGRTLDVCEIGDDSYGYAYLSTSLAERATGQYSVTIATDAARQLVTQLLVAAGWATAIADDEATDEFAERFVSDFGGSDLGGTESGEDAHSAPTYRRALGLARALQAGAISPARLPTAPELLEVKPVLAAHSAVATGRHAAAVALREVLRELYPAALRAYPDPADPVALAVMEALPEPGMLTAVANGRNPEAAAALDSVATQLAAAGVADQAAVTEAITALRVAIAETPRRGGVSRALIGTVAETVRQAVAAVRACDAASAALVSALAERATMTPAETAPAPASNGYASPAAEGYSAASSYPAADTAPRRTNLSAAMAGFASSASYGATAYGAASHRDGPSSAPPARFAPAAGPRPPEPGRPDPTPPASSYQPFGARVPEQRGIPEQRAVEPVPPAGRGGPAGDQLPTRAQRRASSAANDSGHRGSPASAPPAEPGQAHNRPVSPPPPPPPGITPIRESHGEPRPPEREPRRAAQAPRPSPERGPVGSRAQWPTNPPADDWASYGSGADTSPSGGYPGAATYQPEPASPDRWSTPQPDSSSGQSWRADPLRTSEPPPVAEPPTLRLVEPTLPAELRDDLGYSASSYSPSPSYPASGYGAADSPSLRLVESAGGSGIPRSAPPVSVDAGDDDLLIFAQTRSAWFDQDSSASWTSAMDLGWQAAEQAAQPTVGERTGAGLPRRVPHANLVPGAPPRREERPLRVVRDPAAIAAHTSGYFSGWRRGQEVGGFPLGNRPARRAAGAWEFHRDEDRLSG